MFSIKRAVELTGVSAGTLRAWEQRYGIGNPGRTEAGYRIYDQRAIDEIRQMQQLVTAGWTHHEAAHAVIERRHAPEPEHVPGTSTDEATSSLIEAALALDSERLTAVLDDAFSRGSFEFVVDHWLMPALRRLGEEWIAGRMDIASEHFASSAIIRRLGAAFDGSASVTTAPRVLMGTPAGSFHEMGALALAAAARRRGVNAVYLGCNVPAAAWDEAVRRHSAQAVVISVAMDADAPVAQEIVDVLRDSHPGLIVVVGGAGARAVARATLVLNGGITESSRALAEHLYLAQRS